MILKVVTSRSVKILNIAGNSIRELLKKGITQKMVNQFMIEVISYIHYRFPFEKIVTGGQTGVDLAGARTACFCRIPCVVTIPKGFLQRSEEGIDTEHILEEIKAMIVVKRIERFFLIFLTQRRL